MAGLRGKLVMAQSGGPTAVINSSICGVIQEALKHHEIEGVYGAINGIMGVLHENLIDLAKESPETVEQLRHTPSSALGSCRRKLDQTDLERVLAVLKAHNIRYFFYNGGNDSMDTAHKISQIASAAGYEMRVMGIPKTVDNDLVETDHCPGFGSVARWMAIAMRDAGRDTEAIANTSTAIKIIEAMGRDSGWITGATALAKQDPDDAPQLIYLPEVAFEMDKFLNDVQKAYDRLGHVLIAVSEGVRDKDGKILVKSDSVDAFGHVQLEGVGDYLANVIKKKLGIKARCDKPGTIQRVSILGASQSDLQEAYLAGQKAVQYAVEGHSGSMVALVRESDEPYVCTTGMVPLEKVANAKKVIPADYISPDGNFVNDKFIRYVKPLAGELLPDYMRFQKHAVSKQLKAYQR
ncbi:MAG: 6-phosphofructokinase [Candidatus Vecturithrix sp.]|nr:6-phosphofructokinase [Candidatus Vecturithrix sp.]